MKCVRLTLNGIAGLLALSSIIWLDEHYELWLTDGTHHKLSVVDYVRLKALLEA